MNRVTRKLLESRLAYINKLLGLQDGMRSQIVLDHHQPGGNTYTWSVYVGDYRAMQGGDGTRHYYLECMSCGPSGRMTAAQCLERLEGIIFGLEYAQQAGEYASRINKAPCLPMAK